MKITLFSIGLLLPLLSPAQIPLPGTQFYPESAAYHSGAKKIYVGSAADGSVLEINESKETKIFLAAGSDARTKTYDVKIDEKRNLITEIEFHEDLTIKSAQDLPNQKFSTPTAVLYKSNKNELIVVNSQFAKESPDLPFFLSEVPL